MGAAAMKPMQDEVSAKSPWRTQVVIDNQCTTPVRVYLARNPKEPTVQNSIDHYVPPRSSYAIHSGWLQDPLATLIIRTGVHDAKIFRLPHMAQLTVVPSASGLTVTSTDAVSTEDYLDPGAVPNNDTVPMMLREESFKDRQPSPALLGCEDRQMSGRPIQRENSTRSFRDDVLAKSPWNTQVVIDNRCTTPVQVYLARNAEYPSVRDAVVHSAPPLSTFVIQSGWVQEPLATLIMRIGLHEAKIYRMPHMSQLKVELATTGLEVTSTDDITVDNYGCPGAVPNTDTIPMVLNEQSFADAQDPEIAAATSEHWPLRGAGCDLEDDMFLLWATPQFSQDPEPSAGEPAPTVSLKAVLEPATHVNPTDDALGLEGPCTKATEPEAVGPEPAEPEPALYGKSADDGLKTESLCLVAAQPEEPKPKPMREALTVHGHPTEGAGLAEARSKKKNKHRRKAA